MRVTTKEEHGSSLENALLRLEEKNLTVNPAKCLFGVTELDYYGFHITRCIPRQGSYTCNQADSTAQHSHGRSLGLWEVSFLHSWEPVWLSGRSQTPGSSPQRPGQPFTKDLMLAVTPSNLQPTHCFPTRHTNCCWLPVTQTCDNQHTQRSRWRIR